jgi:hypothetical protein
MSRYLRAISKINCHDPVLHQLLVMLSVADRKVLSCHFFGNLAIFTIKTAIFIKYNYIFYGTEISGACNTNALNFASRPCFVFLIITRTKIFSVHNIETDVCVHNKCRVRRAVSLYLKKCIITYFFNNKIL